MKRHLSHTRRSATILLFGRVRLGWLLVTFWLFTPQLVFATDRHWTGATSTQWNTSTNWDTAQPGGTGDNAVFNQAFTYQPKLTSTTTIGGIWMTGNTGQNVTVSGSTLTLQGNTINGIAGLGILMDNANAFTLTINAPLTLGAAQTWRNNSGNLLTIGGTVNTNNQNLTIDGSGNTTISGVVSSGGAIIQTGSGTLTLSGANTHTAGTVVSAGTLNINNATALGTGTFFLNGGTIDNTTGSALMLTNNNAVNLSANFAFGGTNNLNLGTGAVTMGASYTITLNGTGRTLTFGGAIAGGGNRTLTINGAGNTLSLGGLTISNNNTARTFTIAGTGDASITGVVASGGTSTSNLTYGGSGTLTLSGTNTFTGGLTLNAGTLNINNASALGTGTFTIAGSSNAIINNTTGSAITLSTNNAQAWNGNFTFTGTQSLNLGTGAVTLGASRTVTVNASNLTVGGVISGAGFSLTKAGTGTLTLGGANTYSGGATINAGTLNSNNASALGTGTFTIAGGSNAIIDNTTGSAITLSTNNAQAWNGNFTFTGTQSLNLGTGAVTLGASRTVTVSANNLTVGGVISGAGFSLTKAGTGTLTLGGANTYTGGTTVNAGTLLVNGNNSAATGAVSVNNSGTTLGGTGTIGGAVTVGSGANLLGGTGSTASGTLTLANSLTLNSGSIIELALGAAGAHSTLARTGGTWSFNATQAFTFINLGAQATAYNNIITGLAADPMTESGWTITDTGWIGTFSYSGGNISLNVIAVPEPATYLTGLLTLVALGYHQRRRWRYLLRRHVTGGV
jgi:autotransporter-associated beta strand protein